ncbi:MAG: TatD family hydrolase [Erysipelotrichaceae bacterium]|nr:TatD family hydrolase [Erysipelotrichaceae bacterium]
MFIDTHCHISKEYFDDIPNLIDKIVKSGVNKVIVNGCDMKSNLEVLELVEKYDIVYGALGFHPTELDDFSDEQLIWLEKNINNKKIVAIGEIGLDYHYDNTDKVKQKEVFEKQLQIASKYHKPVIVHSRDAINDTYNIISKYNVIGSLHCFSSSKEMAERFIKLGFYIGIGGVCTYKNAKEIKEVIKAIDLEYIILETDTPYLSPEPVRKEKNTPCNIPIIASYIASLKDVDLSIVSRVTSANASRLFDFFQKI